MVMLSIIIPTYNAEKSISIALDSILFQSYKSLEIIIVDGLSSDKTTKIVEGYAKKDARIRFISEKDEGIYDAMNKGIKAANGEWILFLGSDDKLYNNIILEEVFNMSEVNDFNVIYGNVKVVGNTPWAKDGDIYDGEFSTAKILNKNICHQCIFYKKQFVKMIGKYNINYKTCADWDYNLRCWSKTSFLYLPKVIANFNAGGVSTNYSVDQVFFDDYVKNVAEYFSISIFNPLINNPYFSFYSSVLYHQKKENIIKYYVYRCKYKIKHKFSLIKLFL